MQKYVTINWWEQNGGLELPVHVVQPGRVYRRHHHTMGEMACAWFGKIPVVERENGDPH